MGKGIVHIEVGSRTGIYTEGLNRGLSELAIKAEESCDFEDILNNAMQSLYQTQPEGQENYGGKEPIIGKVWLSRFNNDHGPGNTNIEYIPTGPSKERWNYLQKTIGTVNLRGRTYSVGWDGEYNESGHQINESDHQIPEVLMRDTERVMESLGLNRKQKE